MLQEQQAQRGLANYRGRSVRGPPPQFYRPKSPAILNSKSNEKDEPVSEVECLCGRRIKVPKKGRSGSKPIKQKFSSRGGSVGSGSKPIKQELFGSKPIKQGFSSRSGSKPIKQEFSSRSGSISSRASSKSRSGSKPFKSSQMKKSGFGGKSFQASKGNKAKLPQHNSPLVRERLASIKRKWLEHSRSNSMNPQGLDRRKFSDRSGRSLSHSESKKSQGLGRSGSKSMNAQGLSHRDIVKMIYSGQLKPRSFSRSGKRSVSKKTGEGSTERYACKNCGAKNTIKELVSGMVDGLMNQESSKAARSQSREKRSRTVYY